MIPRRSSLGNPVPVFVLSCMALVALPHHRGLLAQQANGVAEAGAVAEGGDAVAHFKEGLTRFREGKYAEAVKAFEKAFALNPTSEQIAQFLDGANVVHILRMVRSDDPKIAGHGRTLLQLRQAARRTRAGDVERIKALVDSVFSSSDEQERLVEMMKGANEFGRNLVPVLIPRLGSPENSERTLAFLWVTKIETDAVPPLVAAARHPNPLVRSNVAMLLGTRPIADAFSLGTLKGLMETDGEAEVKEAAKRSLEAILRDDPRRRGSRLLAAKEYHITAAEFLYKNPHLNRFGGPDYVPMVYSLKGEEVVGEEVAPFQFATRMAEAELVEALRLDPSFFDAKGYRACVEALQIVEYDDAVGPGSAGVREEVKALLEAQKPMFDGVRRLRLKAQPKAVLFAALARALDDRRPEVALKLIEVIQELNLRGPVPKALAQALADRTSRLVRIAAATAIAWWNPEEEAGLGEAVVSILAEAAVSSGVRTVHKALGDADNASRLDEVFQDLNLESGANAADAVEAIQRAIDLPPDLVIIDEDLRNVPRGREKSAVNAVINELRKAHRTASTPVVVLVDGAKLAEKKGLFESEERKVLVLPADCDKTAFKTLVLDRYFAQSDDSKARATHVAARAAEALAHLTSTNTRFPVAVAVAPLLRTLGNRPDEVRVPVLAALGNLRGAAAGALQQIAGVFAGAENSLPVRATAMRALAQILAAGEEAAPEEVLKTILGGMAEAEPKLREASFLAFGAAGASDAEELRALTLEIAAPAVASTAPGKEEGKAGEGAEPAEKKEGDAPADKPAGDTPAEEKPAEPQDPGEPKEPKEEN